MPWKYVLPSVSNDRGSVRELMIGVWSCALLFEIKATLTTIPRPFPCPSAPHLSFALVCRSCWRRRRSGAGRVRHYGSRARAALLAGWPHDPRPEPGVQDHGRLRRQPQDRTYANNTPVVCPLLESARSPTPYMFPSATPPPHARRSYSLPAASPRVRLPSLRLAFSPIMLHP